MPARHPTARRSPAETWSPRSATGSSRSSLREDPMVTLGVSVLVLQTAVFVGIAVSMLWYERSLLSPGGVVVPGYVALFLLLRPEIVAYTLAIALVTAALMRYASRFTILFGRRRRGHLPDGPSSLRPDDVSHLQFRRLRVAEPLTRPSVPPDRHADRIELGDDPGPREPEPVRRRGPRVQWDQAGRPVHGPPSRGRVDLHGGRDVPPPIHRPECRERFARRCDPGPSEPVVRSHRESGRIGVRSPGRHDLEEEPAGQWRRNVRRRPEPELRLHVGLGRIWDVDERFGVSWHRSVLGTREPSDPGFRPRPSSGPLDFISQRRTMGPLSLVVHPIADPRRRSAQQLRRRNGVCEWVPSSPRGKRDPREPGEQRRLAVCDPGHGPVHVRGRPGLQFAEREEHRSRRPEQRGTGVARRRDGPRPAELAVRHGPGHPRRPRRRRGPRRPHFTVP